MKSLEPNPRSKLTREEFFQQIGELARAKGMPCILTPSYNDLAKRRDRQKVAIERRLKARHGQ